jgi:hypothetical protein
MRSEVVLALAALALGAGCAPRPRPLVICHNSNCAGAPSSDDDTIGALDASMTAEAEVFDGTEIDLVWQGGGCVFAHGVDATAPVGWDVAADHVATYLAAHPTTPSGEPFVVWIELKPGGAPPPAALARCALDVDARIAHAAPIQRVVSSFSPDLLAAVAADPRWPGGDLVAELLPPTRADLAGFAISGVSVDPVEIDRAAFARYGDLGLAVAMWADVVTPELLDWVKEENPRWVDVGDAAVVRAWIGG